MSFLLVVLETESSFSLVDNKNELLKEKALAPKWHVFSDNGHWKKSLFRCPASKSPLSIEVKVVSWQSSPRAVERAEWWFMMVTLKISSMNVKSSCVHRTSKRGKERGGISLSICRWRHFLLNMGICIIESWWLSSLVQICKEHWICGYLSN